MRDLRVAAARSTGDTLDEVVVMARAAPGTPAELTRQPTGVPTS